MRGCIYKRSKNSWTVVVDLPRDPVTNKRRQKSITVKGTKKDAERELARLINEIESGGLCINSEKITVAEYLKRWLGFIKQSIAPSTYRCYNVAVEQHIVPILGNLQLSKLQPIHIQEYYSKDLGGGRKDNKKTVTRELSPTNVAMHHRILHRALKQAVKWQLIPKNPADAVEPPKPNKKELVIPSEEEIKMLLESFKDTVYFLPLFLAITTGMRMGEILGLTWNDVDLKKGVLHVRQILYQRTPGHPIFKQPKTAKSKRSIDLPVTALKVLKEHKKEALKHRLAAGNAYCDYNLVCCLPDGKPINPPTLGSIFRTKARKMNLYISFHDLRHIHASYLLKQNVHPKIVSERLGHSQISITQDLYSHVMPGMQKEAARQIDELLFREEKSC